jgi:hypothetical protein
MVSDGIERLAMFGARRRCNEVGSLRPLGRVVGSHPVVKRCYTRCLTDTERGVLATMCIL